MSSVLIVIDEAHHAPAEGLSSFIKECEARSAKILFATATPYRTDNKNVCLELMKVFRRPIAEHMEEGFAPKHLFNEIIGVHVGALDEDIEKEYTGQEVKNTSHRKILIDIICDTYERDNKPKTIIRIPPGRSEEFCDDLKKALSSRFHGIRILDGVGANDNAKEGFIAGLNSEKCKNYNTSNYDVVIGVQRVLEGTDWSFCSHVYCIGIPGSLTMVTQLIGRSLRKKESEHPYENDARVSFFVIGTNEHALEKLDIKHSRHALLSCIMLSDYNVGKEWIITKAISKGMKSGLGKEASDEQIEEHEISIRESVNPKEKLEAESFILAANEQAKEDGVICNLDYIIENYCNTNGLEIPENLNELYIEHLSSRDDEVGKKVRKRAEELAKKNIKIDTKIDKAKRDIFYELANEFRNETLDNSKSFIGFVNQCHKITGGGMGDFCKRLVSSNVCYTIEQVKGWVEGYYELNKKYPTAHIKETIIGTNVNWMHINSYFAVQSRGLVGYKSLSDFLVKEFNKTDNYTIEQVKGWVEGYYELNKKYPSCHTTKIIPGTNVNWMHINGYFINQSRGLIGYESLSDFLKKECDKPDVCYTIEQVKGWVEGYYELNKKYPTSNIKENIPGTNVNWMHIDNYFRGQSRGLVGYKSLSDFIVKECGKIEIIYTIEQVKHWVEGYYELNKKYPSCHTKIIPGTNVNWRHINGYFTNQSRGLIGYESLSDFLAKEFNKNYTIEQVKGLVKDYYELNKKYPSCNTTKIIPGTNVNWMHINGYFRNGSRGLIGYESLSDFLKKECGKIEIIYTIEQAKGWVKDYVNLNGKNPHAGIKQIIPGTNINWTHVNSYFVWKSRGLAGYDSLLDFIKTEYKK
jgi:hypothetical protein